MTLAQQTPDITGWLIGTPVTVLAFLVVAFLRGWVVTGTTYARCLAEKDKVEAELQRRAQEDRETLIPALVRATDVLARYVERKVSDTPPPPGR